MADSIYWINYGDTTIRGAPLAGGGNIDTLYGSAQGVDLASGIAIDSAAGRINWTNYGDDTIRGAPLAGGGQVDTLYGPGQGVSDPVGVAVNPAAGRIYWTNYGDDTVRRSPLAGGGPVDTLYGPGQGVSKPVGMAIDPAAGRIYWINSDEATIRRAPLDGSGPADILYGPPAQGMSGSNAVAIDPAAGRIFWANYADRAIRGAPLAGGGPVDILYDSARGVGRPGGVAIDPNPAGPAPERLQLDSQLGSTERFAIGGWLREARDWLRDLFPRPSTSPGQIYWSNGPVTVPGQAPDPSDNTIRRAPLAGSGTVDTLYRSAQGVSGPSALAVLRVPLGTGAPTISWSLVLPDDPFGGLGFGSTHSGPLNQRLSCSRGTWAPDLLGSFLYRAPQSFAYQWRLNGTDIGGATAASYTPTAPGSYTCQVTATNRAGSAAQTSTAVTVS